MRDSTAPVSPRLAAALQRMWKAPTVASCARVSRETQAQLENWEDEGGMTAPRTQTES